MQMVLNVPACTSFVIESLHSLLFKTFLASVFLVLNTIPFPDKLIGLNIEGLNVRNEILNS